MDQHTLEIRDKILQSMMSNKQDLINRYGSEAEKIIYGKAMNSAKAQVKAEKENQIREIIKQCLSRPTQRLMEKKIIDKQGNEWKDDYEEYEQDLTDYKPSQSEIDLFQRDKQGLPPKQEYKKDKYTGFAKLEVNVGLNKWQEVKYGRIGLINSIYNKLTHKRDYRVVKEVE
jgi:hypothetical protein